MNALGAVTLSALLILSQSAQAQKLETYTGMCDASAGEAISDTNFIVADDESNLLQVHKLGTSKPIGLTDLTDLLMAPDKKKKEADIEGAARNRSVGVSSRQLLMTITRL